MSFWCPFLRATSHSQGPLIVRTLNSYTHVVQLLKALDSAIVCRNLPEAYLLGAGLTQILEDHENPSMVYHVRSIHVDFSSILISLGPKAFTFQHEVNLAGL